MSAKEKLRLLRTLLFIVAIAGVMLSWTTPVKAHVTSIVVDSTAPAYGGAAIGSAGPYVTLKGRVFGELDPHGRHNEIIQDIDLAPRNANGKVEYIATFQITMPATASLASGLMFYEVSNRGSNPIPTTAASVVPGAIYVVSGWQGDLLSHCTTPIPAPHSPRPIPPRTR